MDLNGDMLSEMKQILYQKNNVYFHLEWNIINKTNEQRETVIYTENKYVIIKGEKVWWRREISGED